MSFWPTRGFENLSEYCEVKCSAFGLEHLICVDLTVEIKSQSKTLIMQALVKARAKNKKQGQKPTAAKEQKKKKQSTTGER